MVQLPQPERKLLVIGFGNTLRRDDALGCLIAREVEAWRRQGVQALSVAQLTPELALTIADAQAVYFVDARGGPTCSEVQVEELEPLESATPSMVHASSPRFLLGLCRAAWGRCPPSWLVSVPAVDFEIGEGLSAVAELGMQQALDTIDWLITSALREPAAQSAGPAGVAAHSRHSTPDQRP
ncbi:MAG: hydrogenase maturation protease [Isosphaeraceae bacterium]